MKPQIYALRYLVLLITFNGFLGAQLRLYNETKDKKAQLAESAAKDIASGAVFDKEIQNLDNLSKLQIQRVLSFAKVQFEAGIDDFTTWRIVSSQLDDLQAGIKQTGQ